VSEFAHIFLFLPIGISEADIIQPPPNRAQRLECGSLLPPSRHDPGKAPASRGKPDALQKLRDLRPLEQAAEALGISERTAKRYWAFARAWLHEEIKTQQAR
jgi:hypothetical protein